MFSQDFEKSIGATMGASRSLYFEVQKDPLTSHRFMLQNRDNGYTFTALKIFRRYDIAQLPEFISLYYGYGVHGGFVTWERTINENSANEEDLPFISPVFGFDGIVGLSYAIEKTPLSITCDAKPFFEFGGPRIFRVAPIYFSVGANLTF